MRAARVGDGAAPHTYESVMGSPPAGHHAPMTSFSTRWFPLSMLCLVLAPACSSPSASGDAGAPQDSDVHDAARTDAGRDAAPADDDASTPADVGIDAVASDAGPPCETPIRWTADTTTEAAATAAAMALSPTAMPTWNPARATFESILMLNLPIACPDGEDLWQAALLPFIEAHPDVLQIDLDEWYAPSSYPCTSVGTSIDFARIDREGFGPGTVAHDFVSFVIVREPTGVVLRGFIGNYLPSVPAGVAEEMSRCGGLSLARARETALHDTYPYSTYDRCTPTGSGTYTPGALDVVALDPPIWSWNESLDGTGVELSSEQPATLTIDPSYVTPELTASDTNCPSADGDTRVYGFRLIFDSATGELLSKLPGIGCIVC